MRFPTWSPKAVRFCMDSDSTRHFLRARQSHCLPLSSVDLLFPAACFAVRSASRARASRLTPRYPTWRALGDLAPCCLPLRCLTPSAPAFAAGHCTLDLATLCQQPVNDKWCSLQVKHMPRQIAAHMRIPGDRNSLPGGAVGRGCRAAGGARRCWWAGCCSATRTARQPSHAAALPCAALPAARRPSR